MQTNPSTIFHDWISATGSLGILFLAGLILHKIIFDLIGHCKRKQGKDFDWTVMLHLRRPFLYFILLGIAATVLPILPISPANLLLIQHLFLVALIVNIGWLIASLLNVAKDIVIRRIDDKSSTTVQARRLRTQLTLINRGLLFLIITLVLASILMTFDSVRTIGAGLFASAGIAGIIVGTAANGVLKNLLAGLQIAFTEPIRLDDVVIVEGEWGTIEEIGSAYVIVKVWDLRRLVVPLNYFIEKPFQNWTRESADLLGTVFLYMDYKVPVKELREEFKKILSRAPQWDQKVSGVQITDANAQTMEIRCLVSAANASQLFDLRCFVRESLLQYLAEKYPESLPQSRFNLQCSPETKVPQA